MDRYLCKSKAFGRFNIQITLVLCMILFVFIGQPLPVSAKEQKIEVNYFYISVCSSCRDVDEYLAGVWDRFNVQYKSRGKSLSIQKYNTANEDNLNVLEKFFEAYRVPEKDRIVPIVFFGKSYISGESQIKERFEKELPYAESGSLVQDESNGTKNNVLDKFNSFKVVSPLLVGFANGLTPCSLSMLLFFISLLIARNANIIKTGIFYCAGKFLTYFLLGTFFYGTLGSIRTNWLEPAVKIVMLTAVVIFIILNAMDFLAAKNGKYDRIKLQLPVRLRGLNHKWIKMILKVDKPSALIGFSCLLGVATSVGEFLCTGQIYLTTILYVLHSQAGFSLKALFFFLEYNIAFITPLLIITLILHKGKEILDVSELIRRNMHIIKLINIIMFLALGLFLIFLK